MSVPAWVLPCRAHCGSRCTGSILRLHGDGKAFRIGAFAAGGMSSKVPVETLSEGNPTLFRGVASGTLRN